MSGYELPIAHRHLSRPVSHKALNILKPIKANEPLAYVFGLPMVNHTFLPGHRIMVQIQSTLFPLYDRNPQKFVPNIFTAQPQDYEKATQRIWHAPGTASYISLPIVPVASPAK